MKDGRRLPHLAKAGLCAPKGLGFSKFRVEKQVMLFHYFLDSKL